MKNDIMAAMTGWHECEGADHLQHSKAETRQEVEPGYKRTGLAFPDSLSPLKDSVSKSF